MKLLEVAMLINGILWFASMGFLVYATGMLFLSFDVKNFLVAVILAIVATGAQILLSILND